jgi:putative DNA primase/helicase
MALTVTASKSKDRTRPLTGEIRHEFEQFLLGNGMIPDPKKGLIVDGSIGRALMDVDGKQKLVGWYQCWLDQTVPFGRCGDYRHDANNPMATWKPDNGKKYKLTQEQKEEIQRLQEEAKIEKQIKHNRASVRARNMWEKCIEFYNHPYLTKKNVKNHGLKLHEDSKAVVIPLLDESLQIVGLQFINEEGQKKFLTGSKKSGSFFIIGQDLLGESHTINYAEGYATGASYFEDTGQPVVIAFDAYNLTPVVQKLFNHFPEAKHVIIADFDDSKTGETQAVKSAQTIQKEGGQCEVLMPTSKGDYNDAKQEVILAGEDEPPVLQNVNVPVDFDFQVNGNGRFLNTKENVRGVLTVEQIAVVYNVIKKRMEITVPHANFIADMKDESALIEIEDRCIQRGIPHQKVRDYLKLLAKEFNPVKEWVESKPWDGISRLPQFMKTVTSTDERLKELLMKKWMTGCMACAYEYQGVELEGILVFQGAQGLGKTLWFKNLAPRTSDWLLEGATLNPSDKDSVKQAVSHWIVELGEIESTFKKSDIDQLKAFVTKKTDELRLPYDRAFTTYQRRTAFYASVNAREFLTDTSGNRRFWVVPVTHINYNHGMDMQQVWAEVKETLYNPNDRSWFLTSEERARLQDSNEYYRTQSSVEDLILQHVDFDSITTKPVQMTQLLRDLGVSNPRMADFKDASRILHDKGIEPRRSNGKKIYDLDYTKVDDTDDIFNADPKWGSKLNGKVVDDDEGEF